MVYGFRTGLRDGWESRVEVGKVVGVAEVQNLGPKSRTVTDSVNDGPVMRQ